MEAFKRQAQKKLWKYADSRASGGSRDFHAAETASTSAVRNHCADSSKCLCMDFGARVEACRLFVSKSTACLSARVSATSVSAQREADVVRNRLRSWSRPIRRCISSILASRDRRKEPTSLTSPIFSKGVEEFQLRAWSISGALGSYRPWRSRGRLRRRRFGRYP
jgi:hypothetical protein